MSSRVGPPGSGRLLPESPNVSSELLKKIETDYERFAVSGLPGNLEDCLLNDYGLDVSTEYAGYPLANPWGKASGQLSMNANQVREDVEAGLGFVVLKTVIAQDEAGEQSMQAWAIREARMLVEPITSPWGDRGWTVTWKGRGWWQSFEEYLQLIADSRELASGTGTLIVPSCKYHLPAPGEEAWKKSEYEYSTNRFLEAWGPDDDEVMPLEKDFSPTLAGSDLATMQSRIMEWLSETPRLIREAASQPVRVGLKIFNAMFDDEFQVDLLSSVHNADDSRRPDFMIYGNRLFDPDREFDGKRGVAYGGPELSDRNLRVLSAFRRDSESPTVPLIPLSATGDILTGKTAVEYALRGATSFQMHTVFQLPATEYRMKTGSRTSRALHELYFHPRTGFVLWMKHLQALAGDPELFRIDNAFGEQTSPR